MSLLFKLKSNIKKKRKTIGRGNGSGHGTFSGRGCKGQKARTGGKIRAGFEGGQTPYIRRIPKLRGFKNPNYVEYQIVNTGSLNVFEEGATVDAVSLKEKNLISKKLRPVKLLAGKGELTKKLTVKVDKASAEAVKIVQSAKGKIEVKIEKKVEKIQSPKVTSAELLLETPAEIAS